MDKKNILSWIIVIGLIIGGVCLYKKGPRENTAVNLPGTETFSGKLEEVNTGCFADGECYIVVSGKHVTVLMGWSQATVGHIMGAESFGDLEARIGSSVEVYAAKTSDGAYTLYGSEDYYVNVK